MRRQWILWFAVLQHLTWAVLLLYGGELHTTAIDSVITRIKPYPLSAAALIVISLLSMAAILMPKNTRQQWLSALYLSIPQQFVLFLSAGGAMTAVINGSFADGVLRPRAFILADQIPAILTALLHFAALMEYYFYGLGKDFSASPVYRQWLYRLRRLLGLSDNGQKGPG